MVCSRDPFQTLPSESLFHLFSNSIFLMAGTASGWNRGSNAHRAHRNILFDISLWQRKIPLFISSLSPLPSSFYRLHKAEFQRQWPSYFIFGIRGGPLPARASTRMDEKSEERAGEITNEERNSKLNSPEMQLRNAEAQVWMKNRRPIDLLRCSVIRRNDFEDATEKNIFLYRFCKTNKQIAVYIFKV